MQISWLLAPNLLQVHLKSHQVGMKCLPKSGIHFRVFHQHTKSVSTELIPNQNNPTDFYQVIANSSNTDCSNCFTDITHFFCFFYTHLFIKLYCTSLASHLRTTHYHLLRNRLSLLRFRTEQQPNQADDKTQGQRYLTQRKKSVPRLFLARHSTVGVKVDMDLYA